MLLLCETAVIYYCCHRSKIQDPLGTVYLISNAGAVSIFSEPWPNKRYLVDTVPWLKFMTNCVEKVDIKEIFSC